jgi:hypothetical protein
MISSDSMDDGVVVETRTEPETYVGGWLHVLASRSSDGISKACCVMTVASGQVASDASFVRYSGGGAMSGHVAPKPCFITLVLP